MQLILLHPEVAQRSCDDCKRYLHHDAPGRMGLPIIRLGQPVERLPTQAPPCHYCPKIRDGDTPCIENGRLSQLTPKNQRAYIHYLECRAVGSFPDDAIVRRNAAIIRSIEDMVHDFENHKRLDLIGMALTRGWNGT